MKRRGFFGLAAGAAVVGPSMAKQAIASGMEGLSLGNFSGLDKMAGYAAGGLVSNGPVGPIEDTNYDPTYWPKKELADFLGRSAADLARLRLETHVGQLDPDIACMQSIALQAKIRMQRDRTFERNQAQQRGWLERQLEDTIKRFAS